MLKSELSQYFLCALNRQVQRKLHLHDGIESSQQPLQLLASIAEELGEVATDLARERYYGAIAECIDVAHSALILAINLDISGDVLTRLFQDPKS